MPLTGALVSALAVAACGKRSDGERSSNVPSDLDSMAFKPESAQVRADVDSGNAGGQVIQGRDSISAVMGRLFATQKMVRGSITTQSLHIVGDRAYERGSYAFQIAPVSGGKPKLDTGHYVDIWKYESGQWKIWRGIGVPRD